MSHIVCVAFPLPQVTSTKSKCKPHHGEDSSSSDSVDYTELAWREGDAEKDKDSADSDSEERRKNRKRSRAQARVIVSKTDKKHDAGEGGMQGNGKAITPKKPATPRQTPRKAVC